MARLIVGHTQRFDIPGLARNRKFSALSQKRVTKAVREILRDHYGDERIRVSCTVDLNYGMWEGICWIDGIRQSYQLHSGLFGEASPSRN